MITIKTMKHVATSRTIPGFRSSQRLSQFSQPFADQGRMVIGYTQMLDQEALRQQRVRQWHDRRSIRQLDSKN